MQRNSLVVLIIGLYFLQYVALYFYYQRANCDYSTDEPMETQTWTHVNVAKRTYPALISYKKSIHEAASAMEDSIYRFDHKLRLPLMRINEREEGKHFRVSQARNWLKTQRLVVTGLARNAMSSLESVIGILNDLSTLFQSVTAVFVENDSTDETRSFLYNLTNRSSTHFTVILLGCDTINSPEPCSLNITYRPVERGHLDQAARKAHPESMDRNLVMAALRNIYLHFIYSHLSTHDLLLVLESDLSWEKWDMDSISQGLYYFMTKRLDSLCAYTLLGKDVHDPCTLIFHSNRYFYADANETEAPFLNRLGRPNERFARHLDYFKSRYRDIPKQPVKVAACFQGATFYRLSSLSAASAFYGYSEGEWQCEHSTLSRQLRENYLDTQMVLRTTKT